MSGDGDLDHSAYPVLRLDEVPLHSDETLRHGLVAGRELLSSLQAENDESQRPMVRYLAKQLDSMTAEVAKRNAQNRIRQMISGEMSCVETDFSSFASTKRMPIPPPQGHSPHPSSAPSAVSSTPAPAPKQIPLPSELYRGESSSQSADISLSDSSRSRRRREDASVVPTIASSKSAPVLEQTINGVSTKVVNGANPSRQSLVAMNNAFGVSFVVGATERRRRHVPKKVVVDPEEEKEKGRLYRRKVAMQRLLDRQNARKELQEKLRKKKIQKQNKLKSMTTKERAPTEDEQSDVESISGGDDEDDEDSSPAAVQLSKKSKDKSENIREKIIPVRTADEEVIVAEPEESRADIDTAVEKPSENTVPMTPENDSIGEHNLQNEATDDSGNENMVHIKPPSSDDTASNRRSDHCEVATVEVVSDEAVAVRDNDQLMAAWTENDTLLKKNRDAWLTIQRLRSSRSLKKQEVDQVSDANVILSDGSGSPNTSSEALVNRSPNDISSDIAVSQMRNNAEHHNPLSAATTEVMPDVAAKDRSGAIERDNSSDEPVLDSPNDIGAASAMSSQWNNGAQCLESKSDTKTAVAVANEKFVDIEPAPLLTGFITELPDNDNSTSDDEEEIVWHVEPSPDIAPLNPVVTPLPVEPDKAPSSPPARKYRREVISASPPSKADLCKPAAVACPYDSFDMIFCAAYGPDGGSRFVRKGEAVATTSIFQSMKVICKLYEEWMEVMEDYATVFSSDNEARIPDIVSAEDPSKMVYKGGTKALHYRVKSSRIEVCNLVTDVFAQSLQQWEELPSGFGLGLSWNFLWSWGRPRLNFDHLLVWQKVNHFCESRQLTRKDMLKRNLQSLTEMGKGKKSGEFFEIMPVTFLLPADYNAFVKTFHEIESSRAETGCHNTWILKPIGLSRGRGISMVTDANSLTYSQASVLQRYVDRPMCLEGYKFDLRLYVLVTSFSPLEAFIYKEGFARISTHKYTMESKDINNKFVHLTNSSIQKQNSAGPSKDNPLMVGPPSDAGGSKISLLGDHGLWKRLESSGHDVGLIWSNINALVVKSLVAVDDKISFQPSCFEVYGYDVLIDQDLRPWLIEVNASPAMARDTHVDVRVKNAMIEDTVKLLDPAPYDRAALLKVLKRRLKQLSTNLHQPVPSSKNDTELSNDIRSILGDYVPRIYGDEPAYYGSYERLCPNTKVYQQAVRYKNKIFNRGSAP